MTKASDNPFPSILITEGSVPSNPASGKQRFYIDSADHKLRRVNSAGTIVSIEESADGGGAEIFTSAYASPPDSPNEGDLWLPNNSFYALRRGASAWASWGPIFPMKPPVLSDFTWVNQGSALVDTSKGGIYLSQPGSSSWTAAILKKAAPTPPYVITIAALPLVAPGTNTYIGLCWRQSSNGKLVTFGPLFDEKDANVYKWDSPTSPTTAYTSSGGAPSRYGLIRLQIADNGTNRICRISSDGQHWRDVHSVSRTDYITADEVGFFVGNYQSNFASMTVLSYVEE